MKDFTISLPKGKKKSPNLTSPQWDIEQCIHNK